MDLAIFPDEGSGSFATYYSGGLPQFFDEMEAAVADARARHGVRVFNMSLNILQPAAPDAYSPHAVRLDRIAEDNNAVIFVSAGNIRRRICVQNGRRTRRHLWPAWLWRATTGC